ncbi:hypothetical protein chiPu_0022021 [Chiloscyllium punctatum]|uniref:Uncharacterized protein n=1 Tax=Chiloscyllium punctatum TaxID=137246 RepID=A0A401RHT0_CHIPU|nr:hypothetical protein [Chiloscyllium punctatum]
MFIGAEVAAEVVKTRLEVMFQFGLVPVSIEVYLIVVVRAAVPVVVAEVVVWLTIVEATQSAVAVGSRAVGMEVMALFAMVLVAGAGRVAERFWNGQGILDIEVGA